MKTIFIKIMLLIPIGVLYSCETDNDLQAYSCDKTINEWVSRCRDDMVYLGSSKTNKILTTDIYLVDKEFVDIFKECVYKFDNKN